MTSLSTSSPASTIHDLPDVILSIVIAFVSDTRSRNAASLVCRKWNAFERLTRTRLALRGNSQNLYLIPACFRSVTELDLSLLTPWGHSLSFDPAFLSVVLRRSFPLVSVLTVYARTPSTLEAFMNPQSWPELRHVKLVRWHQRSQSPIGADFVPLFSNCKKLTSLDLSSFYYWTEDLPPVLESHADVAANLIRLNLLTASFSEGFKAEEIRVITKCCPNLKELLAVCMFDSRFNGFVGDECLAEIGTNCPNLSLLHLADASSLQGLRGDIQNEGYSVEDAGISCGGLIDLFSKISLIEELVLDICKNVRNSGMALEMLHSKCPRLKTLKLGHFHGITLAVGSQLDGIALCQRLLSLSIKSSADLNDMGLIAIARGCSNLAKFEVHGCKGITGKGIRTMACLLQRTLVDVKISGCKNLDAAASLRALDPLRDSIKRLHIDCVWDSREVEKQFAFDFDLNEMDATEGTIGRSAGENGHENSRKRKKCKYTCDIDDSYMHENGNGYENGYNDEFSFKPWNMLEYLSLWIGVGETLTPLTLLGLENCPNLEEICIKVEGDCRERPKPAELAFGLGNLAGYPQLSKMQLDCGDVIGYTLTAPSGQTDLSMWERFYLNGIGNLCLNELDYWPPQDRDVNQRSLSLPAVGLLSECFTLRKLFIHGTTHEHFLMYFLRIPNLRDAQLREDYYPAPENDMSTEMRVGSFSRFEEALNRRGILD